MTKKSSLGLVKIYETFMMQIIFDGAAILNYRYNIFVSTLA